MEPMEVQAAVEQDLCCPVCFELTTDILSECGHSLCHECAEKWLTRHKGCPVCRTFIHWEKREEEEEEEEELTFLAQGWRTEFLREREDLHAMGLSDIETLSMGRALRYLLGTRFLATQTVQLHIPTTRRTAGLVFANAYDGVYVLRTTTGTPPSPLFLQAGDVITHVNETRIWCSILATHLIQMNSDPTTMRFTISA